MEKRQSARGRPKTDWGPYDDELWRRLISGEAEPKLEAEAAYLEQWGKSHTHFLSGYPIQKERIRERIKKRYGGSAAGYAATREHHRLQLQRAATAEI
jgi:hypothetical protein